MAANTFVTSLSRGLDALQAFDRGHPEMTLSEVAARIDLNPAAARRSLLTLEELGYVTRNGRRFLLTPKVLRISQAFLSSIGVHEVVQQYLQEVSDVTGDSASLGVLDESEVLYIATVSVKRQFHVAPSTGTRYPAFCSSMGRALLAFASDEVVSRALDGDPLEKLTGATLTDPDQVRARLAEVRSTGFSIIHEEVAYGVVSVAVPIFGDDGRAIAAINCSTTPERVDAISMATRRNVLTRGRSQIQNALKRHPPLVHAIEGSR
mgnify:CR=1 FL=1